VTGRELYAALHLLDRQLVDRDGRLCGKVDDLELTTTDEGVVYVSAVVSGPGALWYRFGSRRLGRWLRTHVAAATSGDDPDPDRIPINRISDIGSAVTITLDQPVLASSAAEHWVRDHVIGHIPGSRHNADE
jgi:sporulation protein YlmC with PRC-barrel domain